MTMRKPLSLLLSLLSGCAVVHEFDDLATRQNRTSPGQRCVVQPARVACLRNERPYVSVQLNALEPQRVAAGREITHRMRYGLCAESMKPDSTIKGELVRSVMHKGKVLQSDVTHDYELRAGVWEDAVAIVIDPKAEAGTYVLHVEFQGEKVGFEQAAAFEVFRN